MLLLDDISNGSVDPAFSCLLIGKALKLGIAVDENVLNAAGLGKDANKWLDLAFSAPLFPLEASI
jgi:hypothetical protein